MTRKSNNFTK